MTLVFRWVDKMLSAHEEFIGLHLVEDIKSDTIVAVIKNILLRLNLGLSRCRGQCYDGASNMTGKKNGVATQILKLEERALFIHCSDHSPNLAANDALKVVPMMKNAFDVTHEICKLIKFCPRREAMFDKLKSDTAPGTPGIRVLCPTRWTVRTQSLKSIIDNYEVLLDLWDDCLDVVKEGGRIAITDYWRAGTDEQL